MDPEAQVQRGYHCRHLPWCCYVGPAFLMLSHQQRCGQCCKYILLAIIYLLGIAALLEIQHWNTERSLGLAAVAPYRQTPITSALVFENNDSPGNVDPLADTVHPPLPPLPVITAAYQKGTYPHQRMRDLDCPRYLTGTVHATAGLGHKAFNYYSMLTAAHHLGLRYLHRPFPPTSAHKNYDNTMAEWLGFGIDEYLASDPEFSQLPIVQMAPWTGKDKPSVQQTFQPLQAFLEQTQYKNICNVVFQMDLDGDYHFAPVPMHNLKKTMEDKFKKARALDPLPAEEFKADVMNVVIYIRNGDVVPTSEAWLGNAAEAVLSVLAGEKVHVHIFSFLQTAFNEIVANNNVTFYVNTPVKHTLNHIINADIVVRASSSFAEVAVMASTNPLFVHPPDRKGDLIWGSCYPDGICLGPEYGDNEKRELGSSHIQTLLEFRRQWHHSRS